VLPEFQQALLVLLEPVLALGRPAGPVSEQPAGLVPEQEWPVGQSELAEQLELEPLAQQQAERQRQPVCSSGTPFSSAQTRCADEG
jgi:hypothetical protein